MYSSLVYAITQSRYFGAAVAVCSKGNSFFGFPRWYKYLPYAKSSITGKCEINITNWGQYWLIAVAGLDIVLRLAGMVAVAFIIWGGFTYITSQGEPEKLVEARKTIVNALIGAAIAVMATAAVGFIGNRLGGS